MKFPLIAAAAAVIVSSVVSCSMNPLLTESSAPYGAPEFQKIKISHYKPAFKEAIRQGKAEVDAIVANPDEPTFENTIEALEKTGRLFDRVAGIFFNLNEADTNEKMQRIAQDITPMLTEYTMYVSLNEKLFERVKAVYEKKESLGLATDQMTLLEDTYKSFSRNGANLSPEDKQTYGALVEQASLLSLEFQKNSLAATNAFTLHITDEKDLAGLPDYAVQMGAATAAEKGLDGWAYTLQYPSMSPFMKNSSVRSLREKISRASSTKCVGGEFDNTENVRKIVETRTKIANLLGYPTYADYALEERMARSTSAVQSFLADLLEKTLPYARAEVAEIQKFASDNGFEDSLMGWDFAYWSERYMESAYSLSEEQLKPYFELESCIGAVFSLATRLYGISFEERPDIPVYHPDVKVFDVKDSDGSHLALLYADFFPRESKRAGAWMTEFEGMRHDAEGNEIRPFISMVTNFTKPTPGKPSLITHDELVTFHHEFGHCLHGIFAKGRYDSQSGTSVTRDFVELPSQIMENWAYEPEYLKGFARHYETGEVIPDELIEKIVRTKNYLAAYSQVRQLQFGILDMAWHTLASLPEEGTVEFEKKAVAGCALLPSIPESCISTSFNHIFSGGYAAGYYSYKWAEVLEADAFSLFQEKGIFNTDVAASFRHNILEKGGSEDAAVLFRAFRGRDPEASALMRKLGLEGAEERK